MELLRCETFRAKISPETCRIRKKKAAKADHHDYAVAGLTYSFLQCLDCTPEGKERVEVDMGDGKRKYTMSEAALKARKDTAIKAGAKRSRKISSEGYVTPQKSIPSCASCGVRCTEAETFDLKAGLCGKCAPDREEPTPAAAWVGTSTKRPGDEFRVSLDFTEFPEMYEELMALAKNEMRTPETQILYLLKYGNFDALKH